MRKLTKQDYTNILHFYKTKIPKSARILELQAERLLGEKLCRCITKLGPTNKNRSIGICTKTVINNKGYTRGKFSCKKKQYVILSKRKRSKRKRSKLKTLKRRS
jgi:hypothetical protein